MFVLSRLALRQIDRLCAEHYGLPTIVLMENAAAALAGATQQLLADAQTLRDAAAGPADSRLEPLGVVIVIGTGSNGGDGLALARHLHNAGVPVAVVCVGAIDAPQGDAATQMRVARAMRIRIRAQTSDISSAISAAVRDVGRVGVIVDALLGTGVNRPIAPGSPIGEAIVAINDSARSLGAAVLSIDLPSGMDPDTGQGLLQAQPPDRACVRADLTVSFVGLKVGFANPAASAMLGQIMIADIGCPRELLARLGRRLTVAQTLPGASLNRLPDAASRVTPRPGP
ncbi:MAG: NAD(P)H-hydrate epimerase [Phycisphaerales bacterium]|jgi:hydroxyethylthiazole kinase-like uncharacterized protein yjeF|nr:NAD(P)H-hydrate epimerase [Phycisphaeraceae bacterium]